MKSRSPLHPRQPTPNHSSRTTPQSQPKPQPTQRPPSSHIACLNHPQKVASHTLRSSQNLQQMPYCEKCSIMLASQGFSIGKLNKLKSAFNHKQQQKSQRQIEIQGFLGELQGQICNLKSLDNTVTATLEDSQMHFNGLIQEITSYFKQIQEVLQVQKYMSYNALLTHRTNLENDLRALRQLLHSQIHQLEYINQDITSNMEAVQDVQYPIYASIIKNYQHKINSTHPYNQIDIVSVQRPTLVFPELPQSLYEIADHINLRNPSRPPTTRQSMPSKIVIDEWKGQKNSISKYGKKTQSMDQIPICFSNQHKMANQSAPIRKKLFCDSTLPQQMIIRQSLSLTSIRENQQYADSNKWNNTQSQKFKQMRYMGGSISSLGCYLADTLKYSLREDTSHIQQTETLLLC